MFFASALVIYALLAQAALAAPRGFGSILEERVARRRSGLQTSVLTSNASMSPEVAVSRRSGNWAGGVSSMLISVPTSAWKIVTGTFVVPTAPSLPSTTILPDKIYSVDIWVGIDGSLCKTGLLQAGVNIEFDQKTERMTFNGRFQLRTVYKPSTGFFVAWYSLDSGKNAPPGSDEPGAVDLSQSQLPISPGDTVTVIVTGTATNAGSITIINQSQELVRFCPRCKRNC